jgi:hypothetical protein
VPSRHTPWRRPRDQQEIFLRDLRGLRARRGLGLDEIAVRTGVPADDHAATETGPGLPSLPALGAYLRGCGEPLALREDRWRRLKQGGPAALGDLPAREPGAPRGVPPVRRAAPQLKHGHSASGRAGGHLDVAGVGCPEDNDVAVVLANAPTGPRWTAAGGGWTGNGCDGGAVWTFNPTGNQPVPSTLTWKFVQAGGTSRCTLAVFVPEQNALGVSEYQIFTAAPGASRMIGTVRVWQSATAGQWVRLGSYLISGAFEIRLIAGVSPFADPGAGTHGRHHVVQAPGYNAAIAASAASATCSLGEPRQVPADDREHQGEPVAGGPLSVRQPACARSALIGPAPRARWPRRSFSGAPRRR